MDADREALRQQWLLRALAGEPGAEASASEWIATHADAGRGLAAYRGNADAAALRALLAAYPTVVALVGPQASAMLAKDLWRRDPPQRGDLAEWGVALPELIAGQSGLADVPYLGDVARLDWATHLASRAAEGCRDPQALRMLAEADPAMQGLVLAPGSALVASAWPIVTIWQAHQPGGEGGFDAARIALQAQRPETALVVRDGAAVRVHALAPGDAAFTAALLARRPLAHALDAAAAAQPQGWAFDAWLARAWAEGWWLAVAPAPGA